MRFGHAAALVCLGLALLGAGLLYWDLQDGYFSLAVLTLPVFMGCMALALLLFPGGPATLREVWRGTGAAAGGDWLSGIPPWHRRAWLLAGALSIYLAQGAAQALRGQDFFALSNQLTLLLVVLALGLLLRKQLRQLW